MERTTKIVVLGDRRSGKTTFLQEIDTDYHEGDVYFRGHCYLMDAPECEPPKFPQYFVNAQHMIFVIDPLDSIERQLAVLEGLRRFPFLWDDFLLVLTHRDENVDFDVYQKLRCRFDSHIVAYCGLGQLGQGTVEEWLYRIVSGAGKGA